MESGQSAPIERRMTRRFPFELAVRFRSLGGVYRVAGAGRVTNMSSGGLLISYPDEIILGTPLELNIDWPIRLDGRIPLQLIVIGTVVRSGLFNFAVGIERHYLRIAGKSSVNAVQFVRQAG